MTRLVEWNTFSVLVRGERLQSMVRDMMRRQTAPIEDLAMRFAPGEMRVSGKVRSVMPFAVPFEIAIRRITPEGRKIRVALENAAAFGFVPIPKLLFQLAQGKVARDGVELDAVTGNILVSLDRFLPSFIDVDVEEIRIVDAGLSVRLGPGGADPPADFGGPAA